MIKLATAEQFEEVVSTAEPFLLLKHSVTCPISLTAYEEYQEFILENPKYKCYFLTVQDARPLSNYIAEKYHIKHESPQAILFVNKEVAWHASHRKVTNNALRDVLEENQ